MIHWEPRYRFGSISISISISYSGEVPEIRLRQTLPFRYGLLRIYGEGGRCLQMHFFKIHSENARIGKIAVSKNRAR